MLTGLDPRWSWDGSTNPPQSLWCENSVQIIVHAIYHQLILLKKSTLDILNGYFIFDTKRKITSVSKVHKLWILSVLTNTLAQCVLVCQTGSIRAIIISYPVSESLLWGKLWLFEVRQRNEKNSYEEFRYFFFGEFFSGIIFREQRSIIRITSAVVRGELSKVIRGHSEVTREHYHHRQHHHHMYIPYFCFALFELVQELFSPEIKKSFRVIFRSTQGHLESTYLLYYKWRCFIPTDKLFKGNKSTFLNSQLDIFSIWFFLMC